MAAEDCRGQLAAASRQAWTSEPAPRVAQSAKAQPEQEQGATQAQGNSRKPQQEARSRAWPTVTKISSMESFLFRTAVEHRVHAIDLDRLVGQHV